MNLACGKIEIFSQTLLTPQWFPLHAAVLNENVWLSKAKFHFQKTRSSRVYLLTIHKLMRAGVGSSALV